MEAQLCTTSDDDRWLRAANDVVGCELAFRLRLLRGGAKGHEVAGVFATRDNVLAALPSARHALETDPCGCLSVCRCRHEALAIVIAGKAAKMMGTDLDEAEFAAIERINKYLDDRS